MEGKLYLVATPIGNLQDITLRAIRTLKEVDIIVAEDTRHTLKLLNHLEISKPLISYQRHSDEKRINEIIEKILEGKNIALVTDAGTPGISDPGSVVVRKCIENNIPFEVLPGATAITTALVYSGLDTTKFIFRGFIPRETKERKILTEEIKDKKETLIFYESPHRLIDSLDYLKQSLGNRDIAVCRELTKLHEDIYRGSIQDAYNWFLENKPRGEFVLVISGKSDSEFRAEKEKELSGITIEQHLINLINQGIDKKDAIKIVAKEREIPKKEVYKIAINL